jgi:hypothetical protein
MATSSFDEMMVIDTPEAARNLEAAFWDAEIRGPLNFKDQSVTDQLRCWAEFVKDNPKWVEREIAKAKERLRAQLEEEEREDVADMTEKD